MKIPREDWALIFGLRDEVIDSDHPDFDELMEAHAIEEWIANGAPPLEPDAVSERPSSAPQQSPKPPVPILALNLKNAATALGVSDEYFREHVKPELQIVRRGRRQFVARAELDRWLADSQEPT